MSQKHLFITDPAKKLNLTLDTSLRIARALAARGHRAYLAEPRFLQWSLGGRPEVRCQEVLFQATPGGEMSVDFGKVESTLCREFGSIHMRRDPPFDIDYVATTWMLDGCVDDSRVINAPNALRGVNEKLGLYLYPQHCRRGLVSAQNEELLAFTRSEAGGDAIVKPLDLFGGRGVFRIDLSSTSSSDALTALSKATANESRYVIIQPFDASIADGEVRVFTVAGKALAWALKRPIEGAFLANTGAGASLHSYTPSAETIAWIEGVAMDLYRRGIVFCGMDIIGGALSEINVTSPRLLWGPDDHTDYFGQIAEWLEGYVASK